MLLLHCFRWAFSKPLITHIYEGLCVLYIKLIYRRHTHYKIQCIIMLSHIEKMSNPDIVFSQKYLIVQRCSSSIFNVRVFAKLNSVRILFFRAKTFFYIYFFYSFFLFSSILQSLRDLRSLFVAEMGPLPMELLVPFRQLKALNLSGNHLDNALLLILKPVTTLEVSYDVLSHVILE